MSSEVKIGPDDILAFRPDLDIVRANAQNTRTALKNRAFSNSATTPFVNTTVAISAVAILQSKASGIFMASVDAAIQQAATGTYRFEISTQLKATAFAAPTNGLLVGPNAYVASGGSITIAGGSGTLLQYDSGTQTIGTAATAATFAWSGILQDSISSTTEVTGFQGNYVAFYVSTVFATEVPTYTAFSISLVELP